MVGEVGARVDVEVLGRHDVPVAVLAGDVLADRAGHRGAAGHRERAALAEVILHIDDDQCAHGANAILRTREARRLGSTKPSPHFRNGPSRVPPAPRLRGPAIRRPRGGAAGDADELGEGRGEHGVRVPGGRPDHVVLVQPGVDQRADRAGMPDRADAADGCPVQARTDEASARSTTTAPTSAATRPVSTRCAPLVITSNGSPPALNTALNTRLLAIAPTSHPSWAAADAAVGARSGSSTTSPETPRSRSTAANLA